jgi:hypothetical protein
MDWFLPLFFSLLVAWAGENVEISGTYVSDDKNNIYLTSDTEDITLKKKELTKEGVKQILANQKTKLTLFVPEKSIVERNLKEVPEKE